MNTKEQILKIKINELEKLNATRGEVKHYTWRCLAFAIIGLPASIYFIYMSNLNHLTDGMAVGVGLLIVSGLMLIITIMRNILLNRKIKNKKKEISELMRACCNEK